MKTSDQSIRKAWRTTNVENLLRHKGGTYYGRFRVSGKRKLVSLQTSVFAAAKLRLRDEANKIEEMRHSGIVLVTGETRMRDLIRVYQERVKLMDISPSAKVGREKAIKRILRTWQGFEDLEPKAVLAPEVWAWVGRLKTEGSGFVIPGAKTRAIKGASASSVNQSVTALQHLLDLAVEAGAVHRNVSRQKPPVGFGRLRKKAAPKPVHLPPHDVMQRLMDEIEKPDAEPDSPIYHAQKAHCLDVGEFCRFMGYCGARQTEAGCAVWDDDRGTYLIVHGTKSTKSVDRTVPINPSLRALLDQIRRRRQEEATLLGVEPPKPSDSILMVREAQNTLDRACKTLNVPRLTHHDFRHLFATRCLEAGVDPKTVADWLGHADGGVLVLRIYGHVRKDHAVAAAAKVSF